MKLLLTFVHKMGQVKNCRIAFGTSEEKVSTVSDGASFKKKKKYSKKR